jgi:hypothetical protein
MGKELPKEGPEANARIESLIRRMEKLVSAEGR